MVDRVHTGNGRTRIHRVTRGLFVLRYVASGASVNGHGTQHNAAPTIRVTPQEAADIEILAWPDAPRNELRGPGDGLVIRALHDTTIVFEVMPSYAGASVDAELHLEPVSRLAHGGFHRIQAIAPRGGLEPPPDIAAIEVLAHVARRGDVVTPADTWICGPDYPMAIEGIEIRWPRRPAGLDITTTVSISKNGIRNLPAVTTGEFAGTRGRAAPITSLEMALTGESARNFALRADALFLGSSVQSRTGQSISLIGPTGREPLVGLRLSVGEIRQASHPIAAPAARPGTSLGSGARIRVFRGLKKGQPTGAARGSAIGERERV